jgi:hypothetical protein
MPHHQGKGHIPLSAQNVQVGMAHSRRRDFDGNFTGAGVGEFNVGNGDICAVKNDGLHFYPL